MMQMMNGITFILVLLHLAISCISATHFRGGSISWRNINSTTVEFNFWFAWRDDFREYGHDHCTSLAMSNHDTLRFGQDLKYKGDGDLSYTPVYEIEYQCTDKNPDFGWVVGAGKYTFTSPSQEFTMSLETCCWIRLQNYRVPRNIRLTSGVDLSAFSGMEEINNSPIVSTIPLQRIQQQCNAMIKIAVSDPDGDDVRCRWATNNERKDDCDEVCGPLPEPVELYKRECVISFEPVDLAPGYYAVTVMVEDFTTITSRRALSKVPVQFLLEVYTSDRACHVKKPSFIAPTPANGQCISVPVDDQMQMRIMVRNSDVMRPIVEIASVGLPLGMTKSDVSNGSQSTDYFVDLSWTPTLAAIGAHQICFIAQDHGTDRNHYASEQTCVTLNVGGTPLLVVPQLSFPSPGQVVPSFTDSWTIIFDDDIKLPKIPAFVTFLNATGQPVYTVSIHDAGQTHASVLPRHIALRVETPQLTLDMDTEYTIRIHQGVAEGQRRGCGHILSEFAEWGFRTDDRYLPGNLQRPEELRMVRPTPDCGSSLMVMYIPRTLVGAVDPSTMHLDDSKCTGAYHNETHYSIGTTYGMCNTQVHESNSLAQGTPIRHYDNVVHIPPQPYNTNNDSVITRDHFIEIQFTCTMANRRPIFAEFDPNVTTVVYHESGYGEFQFSLHMTTDETFATKYKTADFPVVVDVQQQLYFEARLYATGPVDLFLQSCKATPTANPRDIVYYEFLREGCPMDGTVEIHESPNPKKSRFSIGSFAFLGHFIGSTVFVHCDMKVCNTSDPACDQKCGGVEENRMSAAFSLAKRDVSSQSRTTLLTYTNTDGPIRIEPNNTGKRTASSSSQLTQSSGYSAASLIEIPLLTFNLFILIILLVVVLRFVTSLRHVQQRKPKLKLNRDPVTLDISRISKA